MLELLKFSSPAIFDETRYMLPGDRPVITGQSGLLATTQVATGSGWRAVSDLVVGDLVLTFDAGLQPVWEIQRDTLNPAAADHPSQSCGTVHVPQGALGNDQGFDLMPDQGVLVESRADQAPDGSPDDSPVDPFCVIPARALIGQGGIHLRPADAPLNVSILSFSQDAVIYTRCGLRTYCPSPTDLLTAAQGPYRVLGADQSQALLAGQPDMRLGYDPDEVSAIPA